MRLFLKKKWKITSVIMLTGILITVGFLNVEYNKSSDIEEEFAIPLMDKVTLKSQSNQYQLVQVDQSTKKGIRTQEQTTTYKVMEGNNTIGTYSLTIREIDNGDKFVFNRFINEDVTSERIVPITISVGQVASYDVFAFDDIEVEREHSNVFGVDPTTNVKGLYRFVNEKGESTYSMYVSQNYISESLEKTYEDGEKSILRKLIDENKNYKLKQNGDGFQFELELKTTGNSEIEGEQKQQISESWLLLSKDTLFEREETIQSYKEKTNYYFIHNPKWNTADGNYTKLPWSVEPSEKMAYGRNLVSLQDRTSLDSYEKTQDRFFYDMVINSVNYLMDFKKDGSKIWETEYTSTWLKKAYGVQAPYIDTRHNENIALFLTRAGELLDINEIKDSYVMYADFLSNQKTVGNVIETKQGYYIADYFSKKQKSKTHVSLNHALGEMNFLLETYMKSKNEKYFETAMKLKQAVEETGIDWINPTNGDFWYQINGDYTFKDTDYPTLTLEDLTKSLTLFKKMEIEYSPILKEMIQSKLGYIISNQTPIPSATVDQLKLLGFEKELSDYAFVITF